MHYSRAQNKGASQAARAAQPAGHDPREADLISTRGKGRGVRIGLRGGREVGQKASDERRVHAGAAGVAAREAPIGMAAKSHFRTFLQGQCAAG